MGARKKRARLSGRTMSSPLRPLNDVENGRFETEEKKEDIRNCFRWKCRTVATVLRQRIRPQLGRELEDGNSAVT